MTSESYKRCSVKLNTVNKIREPYVVSRIAISEPASDSSRRKNEIALSLFPKFSAFVNKTATCWLWTAGVDKYGYGQIAVPGCSPMKTHRLAWMFANGPITSAQHVLHRCDVTRCVNPDHLFLGDQAANMKDAAAKGRLHVARPNRRRLSNAAMAAIVTAPVEHGAVTRLAREHGVSKAYVSALRSGHRAWRTA